MGQDYSILAVKKQHIREWANFLDGSKETVRSLREVHHHTEDNVLRGGQTNFKEDLKNFGWQSFTESSLNILMKERITAEISNIASTVFMSGDMRKKEIRCASERQAFANGGQDMCFLLLITYVATQADSCYKFRFSITYDVFQSSLQVEHYDPETRSAQELSDVDSNRRSMYSNMTTDSVTSNESRPGSPVEPNSHPDSSGTRTKRPISSTLSQGDSRLSSSQADVNL